ncbi:hypothetical protein DNTS_002496 [Danionella cerebrum]|uniref:Uncharacterized protein n=1 Tax=Danionella cerebrum TaxID=2873325 RepID=A0A553RAL3_9TELE|nr:hypothetical protein DNTS_002496 [Danionella translucida]
MPRSGEERERERGTQAVCTVQSLHGAQRFRIYRRTILDHSALRKLQQYMKALDILHSITPRISQPVR